MIKGNNIFKLIVKRYPVIGFLGLFGVSLIIVRKNLYEQGYPTFGDLHFPVPDIMISFSQYIYRDQGFTYAGTWQTPFWLISYLIYIALGQDLYVKFLLVLAYYIPMLIAGLTIYSLIADYIKKLNRDGLLSNFTVFIGGLSYIAAPIVSNVGGMGFLGSLLNDVYISYPLFIYMVLKEKISFPKLVLISTIIAVFLGSPRELVFYILFSSMVLLFSVMLRLHKNIRGIIVRYVFFIVSIVILHSFSIIPHLIYKEISEPYYLKEQEKISEDTIKMMSSKAELVNSLRQMMKWWSVIDFKTDNYFLYIGFYISSFAFPILAFLVLLMSRGSVKRISTIIALSAVILIFLVKGSNPPLGEIYIYIATEAPLPFQINWFFREPSKFFMYLAFHYSFLITLSSLFIISAIRSRISKISFVILLIIAIMFYSWPLYTGNMNGIFHLTPLPSEYMVLRNAINRCGSILWIPPYEGGIFTWSKVTLTPDPIYILSPLPFYSLDQKQMDMVFSYILSGTPKEIFDFLRTLNIKYIAIRNDSEYMFKLYDPIIKALLTKINMLIKIGLAKNIYNGSYITYYELLYECKYANLAWYGSSQYRIAVKVNRDQSRYNFILINIDDIEKHLGLSLNASNIWITDGDGITPLRYLVINNTIYIPAINISNNMIYIYIDNIKDATRNNRSWIPLNSDLWHLDNIEKIITHYEGGRPGTTDLNYIYNGRGIVLGEGLKSSLKFSVNISIYRDQWTGIIFTNSIVDSLLSNRIPIKILVSQETNKIYYIENSQVKHEDNININTNSALRLDFFINFSRINKTHINIFTVISIDNSNYKYVIEKAFYYPYDIIYWGLYARGSYGGNVHQEFLNINTSYSLEISSVEVNNIGKANYILEEKPKISLLGTKVNPTEYIIEIHANLKNNKNIDLVFPVKYYSNWEACDYNNMCYKPLPIFQNLLIMFPNISLDSDMIRLSIYYKPQKLVNLLTYVSLIYFLAIVGISIVLKLRKNISFSYIM